MTRSYLDKLHSIVLEAIEDEGLRPLAKRLGVPLGLVRGVVEKRNLTIDSAFTLAEKLGLEFYVGPSRQNALPIPVSEATDSDMEEAELYKIIGKPESELESVLSTMTIEPGVVLRIEEPIHFYERVRHRADILTVGRVDNGKPKLYIYSVIGKQVTIIPTDHKGIQGKPMPFSMDGHWDKGFVEKDNETHSFRNLGAVLQLLVPADQLID